MSAPAGEYLTSKAQVKDYLTRRKELVMERGAGLSLPTAVKGRASLVDVVWEPRPGVVSFFIPMPVKIDEAHRRALAVAIARVNAQLVVGGFQLIPDLVYATHAFLTHEGGLSTQVVDASILACRATAARYVDELDAIARGEPPRAQPAPTAPAPRVRSRFDVTYRPARLEAGERAALAEAVTRERPGFAHRMPAIQPNQIEELVQPFFAGSRVLQVQSLHPFPAQTVFAARSPAGTWRVLTGRVDALAELAAEDPPALLGDAEAARAYVNICGFWTADSELGELFVARFDDLPWRRDLDPAARARVEALRGELADRVTAQAVAEGPDGFEVTTTVLANRRLLRRHDVVPPDGRLRRTEEVLAEDLPVPAGRLWGMVDGRFLPIG